MKLETIIGIIIIVTIIAITVLISKQAEVPSELLVVLTGLVTFIIGLASKNPFNSGENDNGKSN